MEPWYKTTTPRREVREGRSFDPDEFAIALERVVAGNAPQDYQDPVQFFARTCFTRALRDHAGMVLRRLKGETQNTAAVLTLTTQFGGGKTHTLTTLYHIVKNGPELHANPETSDMLSQAHLPIVENVRVAVFVGNAWDPHEGNETPWIDIARQLAGDKGVAELGSAAKTTPPGTQALYNLFKAANGPVLILMDEVLNFFNRHRPLADGTYAFFDNLNRAMSGMTHGALMVSLPQSKPEMTDSEFQWQERITKVSGRVARNLIVNDEAEISEVVRRRLFEGLGDERVRKRVAKAYADWCFERRNQLPTEWTAVDTATTEAKAREQLRHHFELCYPFHPATLSVFQRKWQALPQYQQTRGTLAMLAQWVSWVYREGYEQARKEPLITLGRAPLESSDFRGVILGQLGEPRLLPAIQWDISGENSHAHALDADSKGALKDIHRRVATAILFESSGGQVNKVAYLPDLRFALGEPGMDTTTIDNMAHALETRAFFIRKIGADGFQIRHQPTLKKVVSDRRASLDRDTEVKPAMRELVKHEFHKGAPVPVIPFPDDGGAVPDTTKLTIAVVDPDLEWTGAGKLREQIAEWTRKRGKSPRLYPGSLVWCLRKPGRTLHDKAETMLAWKRVAKEVEEGTLGWEIEPSERRDVRDRLKLAEDEATEAVWGEYRFAVILDNNEADGLKVIDLGAGHSSSSTSLAGRVVQAMKSGGLLNESPGAGFLERRWPPAFQKSGAWPLASLRQAFFTGALDRLVDPDAYLQSKVPEFVQRGDFGLASGSRPEGDYERVWFKEAVNSDEVAFESDVFLLKREVAERLKEHPVSPPEPQPPQPPEPPPEPPEPQPEPTSPPKHLRLIGTIPPESWNRFGTKVIPKLRVGDGLEVGIDLRLPLAADQASHLKTDLQQILQELGLTDRVEVREE
jgi:hypothetical protein